MIPAARVSAAIEILADIEGRRRPAADAMKDWGLTHRFAGSGDRAAISALLYDALRRKSSSAWLMGEATPRAEAIGALKQTRGLDPQAIAALFTGEGHAPAPLTDAERERLTSATLEDAPAFCRGRLSRMARAPVRIGLRPPRSRGGAGARRTRTRRFARQPPEDNARQGARRAAHLNPQPTPLSPVGLRIAIRPDGRGPALAAEPAYVKGLVEVQDEGSQIAALLGEARPGMQVLDLCAGAGGKTLALAAQMDNHGQVYATDDDGRRLTPIFERLARSGARNVQVRAPKGQADVLADLKDRCDLVMIDAPCTGSGAWRRNPDAKWRTRPGAIEQRIKDQDETLEKAVRFVKPGGRLVYVTCSVLRAENEDRVAAFLARHDGFLPVDAATQARATGLAALAEHTSPFGPGFRLSPLTTGTDGFYVATLVRI